MTAVCAILPAGLPTSVPPDPVTACLDDVMLATGRLIAATLAAHDAAALRIALGDAATAHATALRHRDALLAALAPATDDAIREEGLRLLRAWPQDRRGDLAGYGAELGILLRERRPSLRGLQQACRTLKLTRVHPPAIAEVMGAIEVAEAALQLRARMIAGLPDRIARAEAKLVLKPGRSAPAGVEGAQPRTACTTSTVAEP